MRPGPRWARAGVTLPELILVAWLFALVLLGLARLAAAQGRLAALAHDRVRAADLVRTTDLVLSAELRLAGPGDYALGGDSVRLRAVRGSGPVCGRDVDAIRVRYRGIRQPDSRKDSVLVITAADPRGTAHDVSAVAPDSGCGGGYRLTLVPPAAGSVGVALVFESGTYHLSRGALRYRLGGGGRQPITEAILDVGWLAPGPGRLEVGLILEPDSLPRLDRHGRAVSVRLLNGAGIP